MTAVTDVSSHAIARARWRPAEIAFWILAASCAFLFPSRYLIMTDIIRLALFTLSLDLILGYAGIVSLGHAAFFGVGAYSAGLLALHGIINEPVIALVAAGLIAGHIESRVGGVLHIEDAGPGPDGPAVRRAVR